jgi:hypothetical protein
MPLGIRVSTIPYRVGGRDRRGNHRGPDSTVFWTRTAPGRGTVPVTEIVPREGACPRVRGQPAWRGLALVRRGLALVRRGLVLCGGGWPSCGGGCPSLEGTGPCGGGWLWWRGFVPCGGGCLQWREAVPVVEGAVPDGGDCPAWRGCLRVKGADPM